MHYLLRQRSYKYDRTYGKQNKRKMISVKSNKSNISLISFKFAPYFLAEKLSNLHLLLTVQVLFPEPYENASHTLWGLKTAKKGVSIAFFQ